jgi:isopentenyl diphosphate isomerase/L-lactate dehydrogenase-like FMN-dependent dehydrogenase
MVPEFQEPVAGHPRYARGHASLGMDLAFPVIVSPAGAQTIDPAGETAVARAAAAAGIPIGLSSFASHPFDSIVRENPNALHQLYWWARATRSRNGSNARAKPAPGR